MRDDPAQTEIPAGAVAREWRAGWPVLLSAALGLGTGGAMILMTAGLFIKPMRDALGWSTSAVTIAPLVSLLWAVTSPFAGAAVDRFGCRRVAIFGAGALVLCLLTLALMPISQALLYTVAVVIGICAPLSNAVPYTRGIASWFRHSVGTAFGLAFSGVSLVALFAVPLTSMAIYNYGWRAGYAATAGVILFIGLPVIVALFRERPASGRVTDGPAPAVGGKSFAEACRDVRLWVYVIALGLGSIPLGGFMVHLQPLLAYKTFGIVEATSIGVLYALSVSAGRIGGGMLLDRFWPFGVAATMFAAAGLGGFALGHVQITTPVPLVMLIIGMIGMGQGAEADFIAYFGLRTFGLRAYSKIIGIIAMASGLGMSCGALAYGRLFDHYGDYLLACYLGAGCFLFAAMLLLAAGIGEILFRRPSATSVPGALN